MLGLDGARRAVLALLLLRGPQTVAELRARSERMHPFTSTGEVDAVLDSMERHDPPLVRLLERQPGSVSALGAARGRGGRAVGDAAASGASGSVSSSGRSDRMAEWEARATAWETAWPRTSPP